MTRRAITALTAALLFIGSPAGAADPTQALAKLVLAAATAAQAGDCETTLKNTDRVIGRPGFADLPDKLKLATLQMSALCAVALGRVPVAYRDAFAATAYPDSGDEVWRLRFGLESDQKRYAAAVTTIEAMLRARGAALNSLPTRWLYQLDRHLKDLGETALRRRLLAALSDAAYNPDQPGASNDGFRYRYAELLHGAGEQEAARRWASSIHDPSLVIDLSLDPRFRAAFPTTPDVRAAVERRLAELRDVRARYPDHIAPVNETANLQRALGRPRDALATLETVRARVDGTAELADRDEHAVWWWDGLSRAYHMAGDDTAALAALRRGAALKEHGAANVSQTINLAEVQLELGHAADAFATLAAFKPGDGVSPYGRMQVAWTRACAADRLGRTAGADIDYVRAHAADAPGAVTDLFLCLNDAPAAAKSLVARLTDPDQRTGALRQLSDFDPPPPGAAPDREREKLLALRERPEVRDAIAAAGGIRRFNIQPISF